MGIASHGYGGEEVSQSGVYKLENQESWWYNSFQGPMSENWSGGLLLV